MKNHRSGLEEENKGTNRTPDVQFPQQQDFNFLQINEKYSHVTKFPVTNYPLTNNLLDKLIMCDGLSCDENSM